MKIFYYVLILVLFLLQICDCGTTYYGLANHLAEEINPIVNILINIIGLLATVLLMKLVAFSIIYFIFLDNKKYTLSRIVPMLTLNMIYVFIVYNNLEIIW